jgi:hypothetical protein
VFDGPFATHGADRAEHRVAAGRLTIGCAHERIIFEQHPTGVIARAVGREERQVDVSRVTPARVWRWTDGVELEPSIDAGPAPALETPRVCRRAAPVVHPRAIGVVREGDRIRERRATVGRECPAVNDQRRARLGFRGDARSRRELGRAGALRVKRPDEPAILSDGR